VVSFPIPLRFLFALHPPLLVPVLQIIHRVILTFLIQHTAPSLRGPLTIIAAIENPP
jgi:hypothetical protein